MTSESLKAARLRLRPETILALTGKTTPMKRRHIPVALIADALGYGWRTWMGWEAGEYPVTVVVGYALAAIERGIPPLE